MAAPIMAVARLIAGRRGQEKVHGFFRKLYKGYQKKSPVSDFGKKLEKSTVMVSKPHTGVFGGKRNLLKVKGGLGNYSRYFGGRGIQGVAQKGEVAGRHIKKHRKAYGWGVTGAAAWDILDKD